MGFNRIELFILVYLDSPHSTRVSESSWNRTNDALSSRPVLPLNYALISRDYSLFIQVNYLRSFSIVGNSRSLPSKPLTFAIHPNLGRVVAHHTPLGFV